MSIRPGVNVICPLEIEEEVASARGDHLPVFVISTGAGGGTEVFFDSVRNVLPFDPPLKGSRSWDALSDSLWEGLRAIEHDTVVIAWPDAAVFARKDSKAYEIALSVLRDVAESLADKVSTGGRPKNVAVYVVSVPS